ncbi:hypothetical protein M0804_002269 [Polistes exclamans]|nr:hypothetical protein M0804_002269 [Polistes exclamans]
MGNLATVVRNYGVAPRGTTTSTTPNHHQPPPSPPPPSTLAILPLPSHISNLIHYYPLPTKSNTRESFTVVFEVERQRGALFALRITQNESSLRLLRFGVFDRELSR